ncbi:MAG: hypothetical protein WCE81_03765 [Halobacteriota archaeon]
MAKYLILWHFNTMAVSHDPDGHAKLSEMPYAGMDSVLKTGEITDFGFFLDGASGYTMSEGDFVDIFRMAYYEFCGDISSTRWSQ